MKAISFFAGALAFFLPIAASAYDQVVVNGYIFQCQTTCVVYVNSNGSLSVRDINQGWVQMMRLGKIPMPALLPGNKPHDDMAGDGGRK